MAGIGVALFLAGAAAAFGVQYLLSPARVGATMVSIGDWRLNCPAKAAKPNACSLTQDLSQNGSSAPLVHLEVGIEDQKERLAIVVPRGVLLPAGLGFAVGTRPPQMLVYQTCEVFGCIAYVPLDADLATAMRQGDTGRIIATNVDGQQSSVLFSLTGFSDALTQMHRDNFWRSLGG